MVFQIFLVAPSEALCGAGQFNNSGVCQACTTCGAGEYVAQACAETSDTVCGTCGLESGFWCDANSDPQACSLTCPEGQGILSPCTATEQSSECVGCTPGTFHTTTSECPEGWFKLPGYDKCLLLQVGLDSSQFNAEAVCEAQGGRLPEPQSCDEMEAILQFVTTNQDFHLGMHMDARLGPLLYDSDNGAVTMDGLVFLESADASNQGTCVRTSTANGVCHVQEAACGQTVAAPRTVCEVQAKKTYPTCATCTPNYYCADGLQRTTCPEHSLSLPGSDDVADCVCMDGFYTDTSAGYSCQACPAGYVCGGEGNLPGSKNICPVNTWCANSVMYTCPDGFSSPEGSGSAANCTCPTGKVPAYGECPAGYVEFPHSGNCYKVFEDEASTLLVANQRCLSDGGALPGALQSAAEASFVATLHSGCPSSNCSFWASAYRNPTDAQFWWIDHYNFGLLSVHNYVEAIDWMAMAMEAPADPSAPYLLFSATAAEATWDWAAQHYVRCFQRKTVDTCVLEVPQCQPGTYGANTSVCKTCEPGYYCPGGSAHVRCPNDALTDPLYGAIEEAECAAPVCGNYHLEAGEQCDNGPAAGDGCSATCQFEDSSGTAAGPEWVCTTAAPLAATSCCPSLVNPISGEYVCDCAGVTSDTEGVTISKDCRVIDVNECNNNNGGCMPNAVCTNIAATLTSNATHSCTCPPGLIGDGVTRCDIYVYQVSFKVAVQGISIFDVNENTIKQRLIDNGVFPSGTRLSAITLFVTEYNGDFQRRRLLSTGVEIEASVSTDTSLEMEQTVENVNTNEAITTIADTFGNETVVILTQETAARVLTVDQVYGTVGTVLTGFSVDSVRYDNVKWEWIIRARYVEGAPNVITSPYVSKTGPAPYSVDVQNRYYVAQHPCMLTSSVCCLNDYMQHYTIGSFADNISDVLGECGPDVNSLDTVGMFNDARNADLVDNMLSAYPNSYVKRINPTTIDIHIYRVDLRDDISMKTVIDGGYTMDFFVGMAYYTLLPAPAISTVASQTRIRATFTDTVSFATSSQQDYTFLQYITIAIFDTKFVMNFVEERHPQLVRVGFLVPDGLEQNMRTGLVPLTSVRYNIGTSLPDQDDPTAWSNPCLSSDGSGLWDAGSGVHELYEQSSGQSCALQTDICTNPIEIEVRNRLVEFWLPIGDQTITPEMMNSADAHSIYIYFTVSLIDATGRSVQTKLFAQAPITDMSLTYMCQSLEIATEVKDILDVSLAIGVAGTADEWDKTVSTYDNFLTSSTGTLDTTIDVNAPSVQNGLLTLAVSGNDLSFETALAVNYQFEIDDLISLHFLDDTIYNNVVGQFRDGSAWTVERDSVTGYMEISLTDAVKQQCMSGQMTGDLTCAIRYDIVRRMITEEYAVHPLATGMNTHNLNTDSMWLQKYLLGVSEYGDGLARNFTNLVRGKYNVNDRYKKAWYINTGYPWAARAGSTAQSILSLSDKTILVAVVSLDDGTGGNRRRALLQVLGDGQTSAELLDDIKSSPLQQSLPTLDNVLVDPLRQIATAFGVGDHYAFMNSGVTLAMDGEASNTELRDALQKRLRADLVNFSPGASNLWITQFRPKPVPAGRRRLLQDGSFSLQYDLLLLIAYTNGNMTVYENDLKAALDTAGGANTVYNAIQAVVTSYFSLLKTDVNGTSPAVLTRIEKNTLNQYAQQLGLTTPHPDPYWVDDFGSGGASTVASWGVIAALLATALGQLHVNTLW